MSRDAMLGAMAGQADKLLQKGDFECPRRAFGPRSRGCALRQRVLAVQREAHGEVSAQAQDAAADLAYLATMGDLMTPAGRSCAMPANGSRSRCR